MLELKEIVKDYVAGDTTVKALKGISIDFRQSEFVSILGQSGCGKTTLLNIIGGLDHYTSGDLIINNKSTKDFNDYDWDTYRNHSIGFIFQSYNLIMHLTVAENVELALSLAGISKEERHKRAVEALTTVGLKDQVNKKPNQLSGGQMQRVAIARSLVNNPDILLADEPTGALDSETSEQVMKILKDISKDRLIIMVTHNAELAEKYSTRIIKLLDGKVIDDTKPYNHEQEKKVKSNKLPKDKQELLDNITILFENNKISESEFESYKTQIISNTEFDLSTNKKLNKLLKTQNRLQHKRTSMKYGTALSLSFKNLLTKKWRTIMTSFAGSIGIIGIALIIAVSNGSTNYINKMQSEALGSTPLTVSAITMDTDKFQNITPNRDEDEDINEDVVVPYNPLQQIMQYGHYNNFTSEFLNHVKTVNELLNDFVDPAICILFALFAFPSDVNVFHIDFGEVEQRIAGLNIGACRNVVNLICNDKVSKFLAGSPVNEFLSGIHILGIFNDAGGLNAVRDTVFRIGNHDGVALLLNVKRVNNVEDT